MKKLYTLGLLYTVALLFAQNSVAQFTIPAKPDLQTSVYDYAHLLSASDKTALEEKLVRYSDSTSTQIVVATVEGLNGDSAEHVAPDCAQKWGIGQAKEDNGIFILICTNPHDMYIATGYGVQGRLPAGTVGTIIRDYIKPDFKAGDYYAGLDKGTDAIFEALNGKFKETRKSDDNGNSGGGGIAIFIIIGVIVLLSILRGRGGRGGGGGGGGFLTGMILGSMGSSSGSSWSSGGSSGGGFGGGGFGGGFGGGGFSGGGAGGSW